jgi:CheY-like chemotaxis protein
LNKWQWVDLWTPEGYQQLLRALMLRTKELAMSVARGLTLAEVAQLTSWRPPPPGKTILIVVDNPDLLSFLSHRLLKGWTVVTAESAQGAVEVMRTSRHTPNIALLDHDLPDGSGIALGIKLREQTPSMAIIITSLDELAGGDQIVCEEHDFIVLMKPFLARELHRILDQIRRQQTSPMR